MTTINASLEAYKTILKQRHKLEEEEGEVISVAHALDVLLEIGEKVKK